MYTTEPCLVEPISADPTEEWSPEMAYDPTDLVDPEEGLHIWSSVNTVVDAIKSGKLEDSDRVRLTEALEEARPMTPQEVAELEAAFGLEPMVRF